VLVRDNSAFTLGAFEGQRLLAKLPADLDGPDLKSPAEHGAALIVDFNQVGHLMAQVL